MPAGRREQLTKDPYAHRPRAHIKLPTRRCGSKGEDGKATAAASRLEGGTEGGGQGANKLAQSLETGFKGGLRDYIPYTI